MKKVVLLSMLALLVIGVIGLAQTSVPVYQWTTPAEGAGSWVAVTNTIFASATGANTWSTGGLATSVQVPDVGYFMVLPATPTWFKLPRINWTLNVSQWIYISVQYLDYVMHVDVPGDFTVDSFTIHVMTNGGVFAYFHTGGNLTGNMGSIPTWLGYKVDDATAPGLGLPTNGANNNFWYDMGYINSNYGSAAQKITLYGPQYWEHTFYGWLGFRVDYQQPKGVYTTYLDMFIQSDP
jgi:hypothetical protein